MESIADSKVYRRRWWILLVVALSILVIVIGQSVVNIALPTLQRELSTTMSDLQWIINAYLLAFAGLMLTMGALGDRWGRAYMLQAGILVFGGANIGAAFATTSWQLIAWRGVMGVGGAMILPSTLAIITNVFPAEERGKAIGVWAGLNSLGIALGPIIGGLLIESFSWSAIFWVNVPIAAAAMVAGIFLLPNSRDPEPKKLDLMGTGLSILGITALVFGLVQGGNWGWTDPAVLGSLGGSVVILTLFILWERHSSHPLLEIQFFRRPRFSAGVGAVSLMSFALVGITFSLSIFMQFVHSYDALQTGIRLVPLAAGVFIGAGSADRGVKRMGTKRVMMMGFLGTSVVTFLASFTLLTTPYWALALFFFGIGLFLGYIAAPATDAVMGALPKEKAGIGSAMNTVSRMVAGATGVAALVSALNRIYAGSFDKGVKAIQGLPAEVAEAARESIGAGVIVASRLPEPLREAVGTLARESFMDGWRAMAYIACGLCIVGALIVLRFMPARDTNAESMPVEGEPTG